MIGWLMLVAIVVVIDDFVFTSSLFVKVADDELRKRGVKPKNKF